MELCSLGHRKSPRSVNEAQHLQAIFEQEERDEEVRKANRKELQESNRLLKQKLDAEKKEAQERRKEERARERAVKEQQQAERMAEKERQKQARDYLSTKISDTTPTIRS